jgi:hypothetical protein
MTKYENWKNFLINVLLMHVRNLLKLFILRCKINYAFNLEPLSCYHYCIVQCFTPIPFLAVSIEKQGLCAFPSLPLMTAMGPFPERCFHYFAFSKYWTNGKVQKLTDPKMCKSTIRMQYNWTILLMTACLSTVCSSGKSCYEMRKKIFTIFIPTTERE